MFVKRWDLEEASGGPWQGLFAMVPASRASLFHLLLQVILDKGRPSFSPGEWVCTAPSGIPEFIYKVVKVDPFTKLCTLDWWHDSQEDTVGCLVPSGTKWEEHSQVLQKVSLWDVWNKADISQASF